MPNKISGQQGPDLDKEFTEVVQNIRSLSARIETAKRNFNNFYRTWTSLTGDPEINFSKAIDARHKTDIWLEAMLDLVGQYLKQEAILREMNLLKEGEALDQDEAMIGDQVTLGDKVMTRREALSHEH